MTHTLDNVTVPHFAFPFRLGRGGTMAVVEQDSLEDVTQCVRVLLSTVQGTRQELPDYGVPDFTFANRPDVGTIYAAVEQWEPRAKVYATEGLDPVAEMSHIVHVEVDRR